MDEEGKEAEYLPLVKVKGTPCPDIGQAKPQPLGMGQT